MNTSYTISCKRHRIELGRHTHIMGILNVTPDSFSDGGNFFNPDDALAHAEKMVQDGVDIIDVGGESTRPFSEKVSAEEEIRRVIPVIEALSDIGVPVSVDTTKAVVARRAIEAGASMINDIGALRLDPDMAGIVAESDVPVILMHMKGTPGTMQVSPQYDDIILEIKQFFERTVKKAVESGIDRSRIIIDPGIGFGKTIEHNLAIIQKLRDFMELGLPVLIGLSRKSFIRNILKHKSGQDIAPHLTAIETGTQAALTASVQNGAHIVRVHDVAATAVTLKIADSIKTADL